MKKYFSKLRNKAALMYAAFSDKSIASRDFMTMLGPGFFKVHIKTRAIDNTNYILIEAKGGESTVYIPLDFSTLDQIIKFTNDKRSEKSE